MLSRLDDVRGSRRAAALERGVNPRDVDLLLADLLERPVTWLLAHGEESIDPGPLDALLTRRFEGEPLQYIRGRSEFYSREFLVDDRVLIPRPETELLVEAALRAAPHRAVIVDVGTGSGCIAITLERERPDLRVIGVDRSPAALAVAAANRRSLGAKISLAGSNLLTAIRGRVDLVVSNPPYVPRAEYEELEVEVRIYEPAIALTPGPNGTEIIDRILVEAAPLLAAHGLVMMEVGYGQEAAVRELASRRGYAVQSFIPDLAGIPRIVVLSRHG